MASQKILFFPHTSLSPRVLLIVNCVCVSIKSSITGNHWLIFNHESDEQVATTKGCPKIDWFTFKGHDRLAKAGNEISVFIFFKISIPLMYSTYLFWISPYLAKANCMLTSPYFGKVRGKWPSWHVSQGFLSDTYVNLILTPRIMFHVRENMNEFVVSQLHSNKNMYKKLNTIWRILSKYTVAW